MRSIFIVVAMTFLYIVEYVHSCLTCCDIAEAMQRRIAEGSQWAPLMLTLSVSRLVGAAPVRFQDKPRGCPVIVSRSIHIFNCFLLLVLHAAIVISLVKDLQLDEEHAVRVNTPSVKFAWLSEVVLLMIVTTIGVFDAPRVLTQSIQYLNVVEEIYSSIESRSRKYCCKKSVYATAIFIILMISLYVTDFSFRFHDAIIDNLDTTLMYLYICFYVESIVVGLLSMQFMWIALFIESVLDSINNALQDFIYMIELQTLTSNDLTMEYFDVATTSFPIPFKPVNDLIDTFPSIPNRIQGGEIVKGAPNKIIRLLSSYLSVCDVIRGVDKCFGLRLMLLIGSFLLHFVITPFYFIIYLYSKNNQVLNLTVQIIFCFYHFTSMLMVVEPGYLTQQQMELTESLVRQLWQRSPSPSDSLAVELDHILKQIELNKVLYSPLKICTVTRPLITKIIGGVTTYLVIFLQFQRVD